MAYCSRVREVKFSGFRLCYSSPVGAVSDTRKLPSTDASFGTFDERACTLGWVAARNSLLPSLNAPTLMSVSLSISGDPTYTADLPVVSQRVGKERITFREYRRFSSDKFRFP